jgi:chromosome segregation protein
MRVKRLEISGFKSFKDKTVIHFDHGITGIVGPNGCGKSNIVDAFFWVMGEQSYKHMRGTGSDDLIFNGSSKYQPLGMAEATMVLETDVADAPSGATTQDIPLHLRSKEVAVTRRVYRDGEGEYFINGQLARLRDIQELFMDTGVGAKGYSVIEQGQIGKIVQAKPEERRLLVEEAAGIAKYKKRKLESLRKMEATQGNLARLNDVIQEIERSLGSLERQAQKARQYRKYKDELLDKEMTWGRRKNQVLRAKLEELKTQRDGLEQELVGLRASLQTAENSISADQIAQLTDTKTAEDLQTTIQSRSDELTRFRSELELARRREVDLQTQLEALGREREELTERVSVEREKLAPLEEEAATADETHRAAVERARDQDERVRALRREADTARRSLDEAKRELMNGITQSNDLTSRAASLQARSESAREQAERLAQQLAAQETKLTQLGSEAERAKTAFDQAVASKSTLQTERRTLADGVQAHEQATKRHERETQESLRSLTQLRSRLQSLEELAAAYEGFGDAPKAALEWSAGRLTALTDALTVKAGYESVLESWLESRVEALLAPDATVALEALTEMRGRKQGRVAVQAPISGANSTTGTPTCGTFESARDALTGAGFEVLGSLADFVSASAEPAARAIANVCVVRDFSPMAAFLSGSASLGGWSVIAMTGDALDSATGTLRGGAGTADSAASTLNRKRAITELAEQVASAEKSHAEREAALTAARKEHELARARLQTLQNDLQQLEVQAAALERDAHQSARASREADEQTQSMRSELEESREAAEKAVADRAELESKLEAIVSRRSELEERIAVGETSLAEKDDTLRAQETELQTLRVTEAQRGERLGSVKRELESGRSLVADRERRLAEIQRTVERASQEREQFVAGEDRSVQMEELVRALQTSKDELSIVKDRLAASSAKVNEALARIKELHAAGDQKTADSNQLALEIEKITLEVAHLLQNLEEKYGPGCLERPVTSPIQEEMTEPVVTREMTAEEELALGEEVERLRERIRRLGEVNTMAVEEYEERKKRYDHLVGEKQDLERSIENLEEAIEHINKTSEERFRKAFDAIADRFERLFPIIFGGGSAQLSLVYPEGSNDILEAGVDILAQPPGKKVSNIGLLSGGEKALTAVSLIFAIFMVKPSPFCVLDEVDAPLDDANIGKFNALLREMAVKSQFILITHNKKTMELNDTLYGVTMEEPGVSKMVSVQLH